MEVSSTQKDSVDEAIVAEIRKRAALETTVQTQRMYIDGLEQKLSESRHLYESIETSLLKEVMVYKKAQLTDFDCFAFKSSIVSQLRAQDESDKKYVQHARYQATMISSLQERCCKVDAIVVERDQTIELLKQQHIEATNALAAKHKETVDNLERLLSAARGKLHALNFKRIAEKAVESQRNLSNLREGLVAVKGLMLEFQREFFGSSSSPVSAPNASLAAPLSRRRSASPLVDIGDGMEIGRGGALKSTSFAAFGKSTTSYSNSATFLPRKGSIGSLTDVLPQGESTELRTAFSHSFHPTSPLDLDDFGDHSTPVAVTTILAALQKIQSQSQRVGNREALFRKALVQLHHFLNPGGAATSVRKGSAKRGSKKQSIAADAGQNQSDHTTPLSPSTASISPSQKSITPTTRTPSQALTKLDVDPWVTGEPADEVIQALVECAGECVKRLGSTQVDLTASRDEFKKLTQQHEKLAIELESLRETRRKQRNVFAQTEMSSRVWPLESQYPIIPKPPSECAAAQTDPISVPEATTPTPQSAQAERKKSIRSSGSTPAATMTTRRRKENSLSLEKSIVATPQSAKARLKSKDEIAPFTPDVEDEIPVIPTSIPSEGIVSRSGDDASLAPPSVADVVISPIEPPVWTDFDAVKEANADHHHRRSLLRSSMIQWLRRFHANKRRELNTFLETRVAEVMGITKKPTAIPFSDVPTTTHHRGVFQLPSRVESAPPKQFTMARTPRPPSAKELRTSSDRENIVVSNYIAINESTRDWQSFDGTSLPARSLASSSARQRGGSASLRTNGGAMHFRPLPESSVRPGEVSIGDLPDLDWIQTHRMSMRGYVENKPRVEPFVMDREVLQQAIHEANRHTTESM